jgi:hypothetical protein
LRKCGVVFFLISHLKNKIKNKINRIPPILPQSLQYQRCGSRRKKVRERKSEN